MEFVDTSGHIFSLPSYNEKPIGYEFDENQYVFYMNDDKQYRLSINNYYIRPIYILYQLRNDQKINFDKFEIQIYFNNTNVYKLISPIKFQEKTSNLNDLSDSIEFDFNDNEIIKDSITSDDLYIIETTDIINDIEYNYYLIPIYVISYANEEGTWLSNLMIHINDNEYHTYCPITIGSVYIDEYEELIINGKNMGIDLPKDIIKSIYSESIYNDEFNLELYNQKLKEYLINYMGIRGELGNYNSAINSLNWFGYGNKIILSKLLKTDNKIMNQYIKDYFYTSNDILKSFKKFKNDSLISLILMTNKELDETNELDILEEHSFIGEGKPKLFSLLDYYEKVKINNHDINIEDDPEKYFYWKPYFNFGFNELCIKLTLLKHYYKKYFLPIHLHVHTSSLGQLVFANDVKMTSYINIGETASIINISRDECEVEFTGNGLHYYTKQIHYIDDNYNEFSNIYMTNNDSYVYYELNDTCISIPIKFKNNKIYDCVLILQKNNDILLETHFRFYNNDSYKNFIIYPKKLNIKNLIESNIFEYWINSDFQIYLMANNKWYNYRFKTKISKPIIDFGKLKYKYYFNNLKDLLGYKIDGDNIEHSLIMLNNEDTEADIDKHIILDNNTYNYEDLYDIYNLDDSKSVVIPCNSNVDLFNTIIDYTNYSKFNQISNITDSKINFNIYMHNHKLVETNNINFDIDFFKILKYHLENNLQYIDGTLLNNQFYTYIEMYSEINYDDIRIPLYFEDVKNRIYGFNVYFLNDNSYIKYNVKPTNQNEVYNLYDEFNNFIDIWDSSYKYKDKLFLRYEVYIHKDLIGKNISINDIYLSNIGNNLLYANNDNLYILQETSENSNTYEIIGNEYTLLRSEDYPEYDELNNFIDNNPFMLLLESYSLTYDKINNVYRHGNLIFNLYDKLFQDKNEYYDNYNYKSNIIFSNKYLNSIHLYGIYTRQYKLTNILNFNKDTDINVNGINFKYVNKYLDEYTSEELQNIDDNNILTTEIYSDKFCISGHILRNIVDADTRFPDAYGLYWEHYLVDDNGQPFLHIKEDNEEYSNFGIYIKRQYNKDKLIDQWEELDGDENLVTYEYYNYIDETLSQNEYENLGNFRFDTLDDLFNGNYNNDYIPSNFTGKLIFEEDEITHNHIYRWIDINSYDVSNNMEPYKYDLIYKVYAKVKNNDELKLIDPSIIYEEEYEYLFVNFKYNKNHLIRNKYYSIPEYIETHLNGEKDNGIYYVNEHPVTIDLQNNNWIMTWKDSSNNIHSINVMRVSNIKRYIDMFGQEIKIQNPSGYWYNVDKGKIEDLSSALNELKRYWFNENENNNEGDTLEEIKNSLNIYKDKLNASTEFGLNMKNNIELRYRYKNFLSKNITGLKGKFRIEWTYVDKNGNIDISNMLDESVKIFNLCVCITNKDGEILPPYNINGQEFELTGNEKEVVVYFRLNTYNKQGMITPFYIKPKLLSIYEVNERLKYNSKECGNELNIKINNRTYTYGDNSSKYVINLYNMFFTNTWKLYDVYKNENNVLECQLVHNIYEKNQNIKINKDDLYDFYLMHDNEYWYGLYISKDTCDNIDLYNISINKEDKTKYLNNILMMKYERSSKEFLLNRMKYVSSNGINHFKDNDIICAYITNNDRLPIRIDITSKWKISPMSLGMNDKSEFEANAEMPIISMPYNDNKYQKGFYKVTVRYSLDRDLQHQFKDVTTFKVI